MPADLTLPGLSELWAETLGDPAVRIAVLDGPVELAHECFRGAELSALPTVASSAAGVGSSAAHGTFVASILFGQHGSSVSGIAPRCQGLIAPIFGENDDGSIRPSSQLDLARTLSDAVSAGAQIINLSGGELSDSAVPDWPLANALKHGEDAGVVVVAAAGNDGCRCIHVPAAMPSTLVVGGMDATGEPSDFSNFGDAYQSHGLLAPGEDILGATTQGGTARRRGTSYAVPIVSGVAALLLSRERKRGRKVEPRVVFDALLQSAITCQMQPTAECSRLLRGRLNIPGAVQLLDRRAKETMVASGSETAGAQERTAESVPPGLMAQTPAVTAQSADSQSARGAVSAAGVVPADCGCGSGQGPLLFALGQLGFDFGTAQLREALCAANGGPIQSGADLSTYLASHPGDAAHIIWTLSIDSYPVYAIRPSGPFGTTVYQRLSQFLADEAVERISLPGRKLSSTATLLSGQVLPVVEPDLGGLCSWLTAALVAQLRPGDGGPNPAQTALQNFLTRVYYERRNLGVAAADRALNFAATNAYEANQIFTQADQLGMQLQTMEVDKSALGRFGSDCWDIKLTFFDPVRHLTRARQLFRFTVDVSDVQPVLIGSMRTWSVR